MRLSSVRERHCLPTHQMCSRIYVLHLRKTTLCCNPQYMIRIISLCFSGPIVFRIKCQGHPDFSGWLNSPSSSGRGLAFLPKCCDRNYFKYVQRYDYLSGRASLPTGSQKVLRPSHLSPRQQPDTIQVKNERFMCSFKAVLQSHISFEALLPIRYNERWYRYKHAVAMSAVPLNGR